MKFKAQPVDVNGMCLITYIDGVKMQDIIDNFPSGKMEGYYEPEKGYHGDYEVGFVEEVSGAAYYVYSRFGQVRIGGYDPGDMIRTEELNNFIASSVHSS